ncbi:MAG: D-glycerate dehydrogenase [Phycisphaerales bacterium]|nr:D-glycerate dehydrogenase [Phycisphaerales bacterium]
MNTQKPVVAITRAIPGNPCFQGFSVRLLGEQLATREGVLGLVPGCDALVTMYTDRVDDAVLEASGGSLKIVCNFAVGFENIDLGACKSRGIVVCNTPDAVTEGTANLAWLLVLATARRLIEADRYARSERYPGNGQLGMDDFLGMDLCGKEILVVGAGRIGYATAMRARAFGMRVLYVARSRHLEFEMSPMGAERVELEEGFRRADVVSVHTPLTEQTRHLINAERLGMMKETAILVNTARGPVVDEDALVGALKNGRLWGAGLDVFEKEPAVHPGLVGLENVVLTPHIGSAEIRWREAMTEMVETNIRTFFDGKEPPNRIA